MRTPKLVILELHFLGKGVAVPHVCNYHVKFGSCATKGVGLRKNRQDPKNWGALDPRLLQLGRGWPPKISPLPITRSNLVVLRQRLYAQIKMNTKNWGTLNVGTPPPCGRVWVTQEK